MSIRNFVPVVWCAQILENLNKAHVYVNLMNRDYEGEIKNFGDTVKINQLGRITVKEYVKGQDMEDPEAITGEQQTLVIDQARYINFEIEDIDNAQTNPKLMAEATAEAAYEMAEDSDEFAANLMYLGASADNAIGSDDEPVVITAENAYEKLVDLGVKLTKRNVRRTGRWVVVPPEYEGFMLKDDRFVKGGTDFTKEKLENGLVAKAAGFEIYVSNNVPNTDGAKYKIIAGTKQGASFAEQILKLEAYRPHKRFSDALKGLHVFGAKVVQKDCLAVLTANV